MRMRIRRTAVCVVLGIVLIAGLLSGCREKNWGLDKNDPVSITIWHYYNGVQKQMFDEMVAQFNETVGAQKGIVVEAFSQGSVNELINKVMDAVNERVGAQEVPDVFAAYADTAYEINQMGLAADLKKYMTQEELDRYLPSYLNEGQFNSDGSIKLFPIAKSTEVLIVNQTDWSQFAAQTGASEEELQTWEGIASLAEQYYRWTDGKTAAPNDGKAFFGRDSVANYMIIGSMQLGTELFDVKDGSVTFQVNKDVMRRLWDHYYIPYINGYYMSSGKFRSDDAKTGDVIALVGSTSGAAYFPTSVTRQDGTAYPIEAKVYPLPNFEGTQPYAVQQGAGMVVTKSEERKEYAATVFLKWFTEPEQNVKFSIGSGYLPVEKAANDQQVISEAFEQQPEASAILQDTVRTGIGITGNYELYTNKAFANGTRARSVVEDAMQKTAARDAAAVKASLEAGTPREEALKPYVSEAYFEQWWTQLAKDLEAVKEN